MTPLDINRTYQARDLATASLALIFKSGGKTIVIRRLPAGMDIAPDAWRFAEASAARRQFESLHADLLSRGFEHVMSETS